ncbi:MAG: radical SAM protein [Clostridium sp.]
MKNIKFTVFYTNICNIKCEHCFIGKQNNIDQMSKNLMNIIVKSLENIRVSTLAITGGEALLFWEDIKKVLPRNKKINISISTNGFWGTSIIKAEKLCKELKESGITQLEISTDEYHQKHIPFQNILNIVKVAKDVGLKVKIIICTESNEYNFIHSKEYIKLYLMIKNHKDIIIQHIADRGNAKENCLNTKIDISLLNNQKCFQIMQPCINYKGDVFSCCGPHLVKENKSPFYFGNINEEKLENIVSKIMEDKRLISIKNKGPYDYIIDKKSNPINGMSVSSLCDICEMCINN